MVQSKMNIITFHSASTSLGVKPAELNEYIAKLGIIKVKNSRGKWALVIEDYQKIKDFKNKEVKPVKSQATSTVQTVRAELFKNVVVNTRPRKTPLKTSVAFAGPTNSGKTYYGLELLFKDFSSSPDEVHVYCAPLRLLAYEVYLKMVEAFGEEKVGFITGEEQINPSAKLLATTAEMAPTVGKSLLVDEAHWLTDPDRGTVWTRLLYSGQYENIYCLTAKEALPLVKQLTSDSYEQSERTFTRKTPVVFGGTIPITKIPKKTAVVCFSRKHVYQVAAELVHAGYKPGVLYGNLPLKVRKNQISQYLKGKYDVMVVTDVIGHGINLPIDNVVFTETYKFNGHTSRPLYIWEGAQIAGRAGRFGLSQKGTVYLGKGLPWFTEDKDAVKDYVHAAMGKIETDLTADEAYFAPKLVDLKIPVTENGVNSLYAAVEVWEEKGLKNPEIEFLYPSHMADFKNNFTQVAGALHMALYPWDDNTKQFDPELISKIWDLTTGPYEPSLPVLSAIAKWLAAGALTSSTYLERLFKEQVETILSVIKKPVGKNLPEVIEQLETASLIIGELKMGCVMFGSERYGTRWLGTLAEEQLYEAQDEISEYISRKLQENIRRIPSYSKKVASTDK